MKKTLVKQQQATQKSKLQLKYEKVLKDIEIQKELQANLEEGMRIVMPRIQSEILPLFKKKNQLIRKRLLRLDTVAEEIGVGKQNKEWFDGYMEDIALDILEGLGYDDEEVKTLYEKYSGETAEMDTEQTEMIAAQFKEEFGIDLDLDEIMNKGMDTYMEENKEVFQEKMREQFQQNAEEAFKKEKEATPKKLSKDLQLLQQDAKVIYMRLVKKLHPDLELDEELKANKTAIVQEVTKAYQENDFLALLQLQITHLDENEIDISLLAEDMLKRYTKILSKQLNEMKQSFETMKMQSRGFFEDFFDHKHKFSENKFTKLKKKIKGEIFAIEDDIKLSFQHTNGWFKELLKSHQ